MSSALFFFIRFILHKMYLNQQLFYYFSSRKSAPESRDGELQCVPSNSAENQISLFVSPTTSLDQKNTPIPSLSLHSFTATNVVQMKKAAESNTENVIDDVVNYSHSLIPTTSANMKASSSSQISFQIQTGKI